MSNARFRHTQIVGICSVIPAKKISLDDEIQYYGDESKIVKLKKTVGLGERVVVASDTTPSDLMEVAARKLISGLNVELSSLDALICVLDFPDYRCPPTSCVLHGKLNLPESCLAFDITHGCAGYVYGLYVAHSLIDSGAARKVLLLVGDTKSRTINIKDRISAPVFGDGAAATLLERSETILESFFSLGANGSLYENIMIPAGGARMPSTEDTRKAIADEFGNIRSQEQFTMNGRAVFDFTMTTVPANILEALKFSGTDVERLDYIVFHQANKSILQNIAIRIGVKDLKRVPVETLSKFGNQAVASIPIAICDQLTSELSSGRKSLMLSGFGVGLSFGTAIVVTNSLYLRKPFIYEEEK